MYYLILHLYINIISLYIFVYINIYTIKIYILLILDEYRFKEKYQ